MSKASPVKIRKNDTCRVSGGLPLLELTIDVNWRRDQSDLGRTRAGDRLHLRICNRAVSMWPVAEASNLATHASMKFSDRTRAIGQDGDAVNEQVQRPRQVD